MKAQHFITNCQNDIKILDVCKLKLDLYIGLWKIVPIASMNYEKVRRMFLFYNNCNAYFINVFSLIYWNVYKLLFINVTFY